MPCLLLLLYVWVAIDYCVAFSASPPATLPTGSNSNRYKLYRARYPLEGGPPQLRLHVAVIVQEIRTNEGEETKDPALVLFDFLPQVKATGRASFIQHAASAGLSPGHCTSSRCLYSPTVLRRRVRQSTEQKAL